MTKLIPNRPERCGGLFVPVVRLVATGRGHLLLQFRDIVYDVAWEPDPIRVAE